LRRATGPLVVLALPWAGLWLLVWTLAAFFAGAGQLVLIGGGRTVAAPLAGIGHGAVRLAVRRTAR
jgi:hypothetical protein